MGHPIVSLKMPQMEVMLRSVLPRNPLKTKYVAVVWAKMGGKKGQGQVMCLE